MARDTLKASKIICAIGKQAKVLVNAETGKTASAHDLRRAFGYRWSRRLKTPQPQELMRHASIETTLTYLRREKCRIDLARTLKLLR